MSQGLASNVKVTEAGSQNNQSYVFHGLIGVNDPC